MSLTEGCGMDENHLPWSRICVVAWGGGFMRVMITSNSYLLRAAAMVQC